MEMRRRHGGDGDASARAAEPVNPPPDPPFQAGGAKPDSQARSPWGAPKKSLQTARAA